MDGEGWTIDSLHTHLRQMIDDHDRRYEQRYEAQNIAVTAALAAQEKAVAAALSAAKEAVLKAEVAAERRFEAVNEFRGQLTDQAGTFMPRSEAEIRLASLSEKIDLLNSGNSLTAGHAAGLASGWGYLVGFAGLASTVVAVVYAFIR